ncbi:MAG: hypothetical protein RBQ97_05905 [Acholeplasma sp.]|nr:hypothetical protein [Acholeplasma sp.]
MQYEKIKKLKTSEETLIDGINYGLVISSRLYIGSIKNIFVSILQGFFMQPFIKFPFKENPILISYNLKNLSRKDYDFMIKTLKKIIPNHDSIVITRKISFNIFKNFFYILNIVKSLKRQNLKFIEKLQVAALINYYKKYELTLSRNMKCEYHSYISFCDSYLDENLISQWIRKTHKTITYTLQHGQYKYTQNGKESNDTDAYENFVSHYIFVWGDSTKNEFLKADISKERIIVAGALKPFSSLKNYHRRNDQIAKSFCVALDGDQSIRSNKNLLSIINEFCIANGYIYYIRFHPKSKIKLYNKYMSTINFNGIVDSNSMYEKNIHFLVAHTSGIIVEAITNGIPLFLFIDNFSESIHVDMNVGFSDENELGELVKNLNMNYDNVIINLSKLSRDFNIAKTFEELKTNYQKYFPQ